MNPILKTFQLPDGREVSIETGRLAKQADGSVVVKLGDTMLLATVVARQEAGENVDFMPLSVEYREKYAAAGRFPGGFFKRETRPSDYEVLIARLVDRVLRSPSSRPTEISYRMHWQDLLLLQHWLSAIYLSSVPFQKSGWPG